MRARSFVVALSCVFVTACATPGRDPAPPAPPEPEVAGPRVLVVIAHPDDETVFAATLYAITHKLDGVVDVVVVTNGEGWFKYSTLAEPLYGAELTREEVGRARLPAIRKREMTAACELLGVRRLRFLDQTDHRYTQDVNEVLGPGAGVWDLEHVRERIGAMLAAEDYDFVFGMLPTPDTHAHHKAATILALEVVAALPDTARPAVLAAKVVNQDREPITTTPVRGLSGWPITAIRNPTAAATGPMPAAVFERHRKFGHRDRLDWRIVVNWIIAEHKSQGTLQMLAGGDGVQELFYCFEAGPPDAIERAQALFDELAGVSFPVREYGPSAGTNAGS